MSKPQATYVLAHGDVEAYCPIHVTGPAVPNWEAYCDSLIPSAALRAIHRGNLSCDILDSTEWTPEKKADMRGRSKKYHVRWDDILNALYELLKERGYRRTWLGTAYYGSLTGGIEGKDDNIRKALGPVYRSVANHNKRVAARDRRESAARRKNAVNE